jgi:Carboxypeptidase regulatory-like domain/TonB-dependent Receptor Plug Domain/TonB dependent receptor
MKGVSGLIRLSCVVGAKIGSVGVLGVLIALPLLGQQAQLSGFVEDPSGGRIEKASVRVVSEDTDTQRTTESNGSGFYSVPDLPPGHYRVEVGAEGFRKLNRTGIVLEVAQTARVDFRLEVSGTTATVNVTADASPINTTDASVSMTVTGDLVENLPLNGRSFQQLITLAPGVNLTSGQSYGDRGEFSVNGQRPTSNYFTVDGVGANLGSSINGSVQSGSGETQNAAGGTSPLVSVDALQEFRILTSSFSAEYGRTPGGQVILLTRSGTNEFHGTLFEYFRNNVLDANDWFANRAGSARAALRFNDFGGTLGGPIIRNNTFFFFSYEGQRLRQPEFGITSVPDVTSRQAASAAVQPLLNAFPVQNGPELGNGLAEFSAGYSNPISANASSLRVDHFFGPKLSAFARYSYAPSSSDTRGSYALSDVDQASFAAQSVTAGLTYAVSPTVVSETRVNWSQNPTTTTAVLDNLGGATPPSDSTLLLPSYSPHNYLALVSFAYPVEYLAGAYGLNKPRQVNVVDSISYSIGTHQLKFGVDYLRSLPILAPPSELYYSFGSVPNAVNNNLLFFGNYQEGLARADALNLSLYGQDTWRISRRLTLSYGLRWDLNPPPHDRYANNGNYVPLLGNYSTGDVSAGAPGSALWNTQHKNFAPRIGLAYQISQTPGWETVLRGGVGLFYDVAAEAVAGSSLSEGFPNGQSISVSNVSFPVNPSTVVLPPVSLSNPTQDSTFYVYPRNFAAPRSWQWNVSMQQALGAAQTLTVSYVAALGRHLLYGQYYPSVGQNDYNVYFTDNSSSSNYQSLQLQYQRRLRHGVTATVTYAWSHSLDDASSDVEELPPGASFSAHGNWGPSDFDIRHSFKAAFSWSAPTPSGARWVRIVAGGWGTDGIITARSAPPVDIGSYSNNVLGGYNFFLRPDVVPGQLLYLYGSQYPGGKALNPAAFVINPNTQGNLGRNLLRGFDLLETDLSIRRTFLIAERVKILFRADLFNLFNHPNFADPDSTLDDGTFGQSLSMANGVLGGGVAHLSQNSVFQTGGPRTVQFSLKVQF